MISRLFPLIFLDHYWVWSRLRSQITGKWPDCIKEIGDTDVKGVIERVWSHTEAEQEWLPQKARVSHLPALQHICVTIHFLHEDGQSFAAGSVPSGAGRYECSWALGVVSLCRASQPLGAWCTQAAPMLIRSRHKSRFSEKGERDTQGRVCSGKARPGPEQLNVRSVTCSGLHLL